LSREKPILRLAAAILAYFGLWVLAPKAAFFPYVTEAINAAASSAHGCAAIVLAITEAAIMFAPTIAFMALQFGVVYYFTGFRMSFWRGLGVFAGCVIVAVALMALIVVRFGIENHLHHTPTLRQSLFVCALDQSYLKMLLTTLVMLSAASIGYMVSLRVTDKNLLLPVVLFAAWIDLWTCTKGPVSTMMKRAPELVNAVSVPIPQAGAGAFIPKFLIGPGDFLFAGLVFAVVSRLKMNGPRTFWLVLGTMGLGMLAIATGLLNFFPALIMLAVGVVVANWREFKLSRQEMISTAVVAVVLGATLPLVWAIVRTYGK
jgi:hypothetical protein